MANGKRVHIEMERRIDNCNISNFVYLLQHIIRMLCNTYRRKMCIKITIIIVHAL